MLKKQPVSLDMSAFSAASGVHTAISKNGALVQLQPSCQASGQISGTASPVLTPNGHQGASLRGGCAVRTTCSMAMDGKLSLVPPLMSSTTAASRVLQAGKQASQPSNYSHRAVSHSATPGVGTSMPSLQSMHFSNGCADSLTPDLSNVGQLLTLLIQRQGELQREVRDELNQQRFVIQQLLQCHQRQHTSPLTGESSTHDVHFQQEVRQSSDEMISQLHRMSEMLQQQQMEHQRAQGDLSVQLTTVVDTIRLQQKQLTDELREKVAGLQEQIHRYNQARNEQIAKLHLAVHKQAQQASIHKQQDPPPQQSKSVQTKKVQPPSSAPAQPATKPNQGSPKQAQGRQSRQPSQERQPLSPKQAQGRQSRQPSQERQPLSPKQAQGRQSQQASQEGQPSPEEGPMDVSGEPSPETRKRPRARKTPSPFESSPKRVRPITPPAPSQKKAERTGVIVQDKPCIRYRKSSLLFERCGKCQPLLKTTPKDRERLIEEVCCCFVGFRKVRVDGERAEAIGFLSHADVDEETLQLYTVKAGSTVLTRPVALKIFKFIREVFLEMVKSEKVSSAVVKNASWKRQSSWREMCDVCSTTIFNVHYVCRLCGFSVCLACYLQRSSGQPNLSGTVFTWPACHKKREHLTSELMLTHLFPQNTLMKAASRVEELAVPQSPDTCEDQEEPPHFRVKGSQLLVLLDPDHRSNQATFQKEWEQGKPVVVAGITPRLKEAWTPQGLAGVVQEDSARSADVLDCSGTLGTLSTSVENFWQGFADIAARLSEDGKCTTPSMLKLKDWPTKAEFKSVMPDHYKDLMAGLPLPDYTRYDGVFNLSARLPDKYIKPDLGPKLYIAYGSMLNGGTTNLHLDMSDAVNVLVHVTVPTADEKVTEAVNFQKEEQAEISKVIARQEECVQKHCAERTPGALWHIFAAKDAGKIRDFIREVAAEMGEKTLPRGDPIHDQNNYLDEKLRQRLKEEKGVNGWEIVQCFGDAVFIPAGGPHQVQNLNSCIKAAEDFVSPEHVTECLRLTEEFRHLSTNHNNHEDKLQVKNILYHSIKDSLSVLS